MNYEKTQKHMSTDTQFEFEFMKPEQYTFGFNKNLCYTTTESRPLTLWNYYPSITFRDQEKIIGKLDWSDGSMKFTGEADESAQLFFDGIIKRFIQIQLPLDTKNG